MRIRLALTITVIMVIGVLPYITGCNSYKEDASFLALSHRYSNWLKARGMKKAVLDSESAKKIAPQFNITLPLGKCGEIYTKHTDWQYGLTCHLYYISMLNNKMKVTPTSQSAYVTSVFALYLSDTFVDSSKGPFRRNKSYLEALRSARNQKYRWRIIYAQRFKSEQKELDEHRAIIKKLKESNKKEPTALPPGQEVKNIKLKNIEEHPRYVEATIKHRIKEVERLQGKLNEEKAKAEKSDKEKDLNEGKDNPFRNNKRARKLYDQSLCLALMAQKLREYYIHIDVTAAIVRAYEQVEQGTTLDGAREIIFKELEKEGVPRTMMQTFYDDYYIHHYAGLKNEKNS